MGDVRDIVGKKVRRVEIVRKARERDFFLRLECTDATEFWFSSCTSPARIDG